MESVLTYIKGNEPYRLQFPFPNEVLSRSDAIKRCGGPQRFKKIIDKYPDIITVTKEGTHNKYDAYEIQFAIEVFRYEQREEALKNAKHYRDMNRKLERYK